MILIRTPERAERLAASFEAQRGFEVQRLIEQRPVIYTKRHGDIVIATRLYARVLRNGHFRCNVTYETIDEGSVIW